MILFEMSTKDGTRWLSSLTNKTVFTKHSNIELHILKLTYKTKIEFVPITLEIDNILHFHKIETASDLHTKQHHNESHMDMPPNWPKASTESHSCLHNIQFPWSSQQSNLQ